MSQQLGSEESIYSEAEDPYQTLKTSRLRSIKDLEGHTLHIRLSSYVVVSIKV